LRTEKLTAKGKAYGNRETLHFLNHISKATRENGAKALAKRETKYDLLEKEFPTTFDGIFFPYVKRFHKLFSTCAYKKVYDIRV